MVHPPTGIGVARPGLASEGLPRENRIQSRDDRGRQPSRHVHPAWIRELAHLSLLGVVRSDK